MNANDEPSDHPPEPGFGPPDNLEALLREWHRRNAERAAAGRDRLLRALAKRYPRRESSSGLRLAGRTAGGAEDDRIGSPTSRHLRRWTAIRRLGHRRPLRIAASIVILVGLSAVLLVPDWPSGRRGTASAMDLREIGFAPPLLVAVGHWSDPNDQVALRQAEQAVAQARAELERALAEGQDPWQPWQQVYRNLRALGRWDETQAEALEFLAYAKERDQQPQRYSVHYVALTDVGNIYLALGDYDTALTYHQGSLSVARDYVQWLGRSGQLPDSRPHALEQGVATAVAPRLWTLSRIAAAQGDQQTAWQYHNQAGELLIDFFREDCAHRGVTPIRAPSASEGNTGRDKGDARPARPSLYDLCMAVAAAVEEAPEPEDRAFESAAIHVRQQLLHEAELLRLDQAPLPPGARDLTTATEAVRLARDIPYAVRADGYRQDFHIPMEELRIAIARADWPAALSAADQAAQNTAPRHCPGFPPQPPIGVLARAELRFLRGVTLAGLSPDDPEALCLIESAIEAVEQSAAPLLEGQRTRFLDRFTEWRRSLDSLSTRSASPAQANTPAGGGIGDG